MGNSKSSSGNSGERPKSFWENTEVLDVPPRIAKRDMMAALNKFPKKKGSGDKNAEERTPSLTPSSKKKKKVKNMNPFKLGKNSKKTDSERLSKGDPAAESDSFRDPRFRRLETDSSAMKKQATIVERNILDTTFGGNLAAGKPVSNPAENEEWFKKKQERMLQVTTRTPLAIQGGFKNFFARLSFNIHERIEEGSKPGATGRKQVTRQGFIAFCKNFLGRDADTEVILTLFEYMDVDQDGYVDDIEFSIVSGFLLSTSSNAPNVDLAFHLFDANKDNVINQQEFSELLAVVCGNSGLDLLQNNLFKDHFEDFMNEEYMGEAVAFAKAMRPLYREQAGYKIWVAVLVSEAEAICNKFLKNSAPYEINVAEYRRLEAIKKVEECKASGEVSMDADIFEDCFGVVSQLLRNNSLPRFKNHLRTPPYTPITTDLWDSLGKGPEEEITKAEFGAWVVRNEHVFMYFDKLREDLRDIVDKLFATGSEQFVTSSDDLSSPSAKEV